MSNLTNEQKETIKNLFDNQVACPKCGAELSVIDMDENRVMWDCNSEYYIDTDVFLQTVYCKKCAEINRREADAE